MFDESNLYENVGDIQEPHGQHPNEAPVPALPPAGGAAHIPVGTSPDGLGNQGWGPETSAPPGAAIIPTDGGSGAQAQYYPQGFYEPEDTTPEAATMSAGITALFVATSIGVGYALGGWKGSVAGLLLSGAVANGYRAQKNFGSTVPDQKHEAVVSSVFAVAGLGIGAFAAYKAYEGHGGDEGDEEVEE